jgi:hypothetical protein
MIDAEFNCVLLFLLLWIYESFAAMQYCISITKEFRKESQQRMMGLMTKEPNYRNHTIGRNNFRKLPESISILFFFRKRFADVESAGARN